MKLSKNFTLAEMTKSQAAERLNLDNQPDDRALANLQALCAMVLQPVRDALGPIVINSGYRSFDVNKAVGGVATSQHMHGMAADIECPGMDNADLATWIYNNIPIWDQLILEFYVPGVPQSGWVHVSVNPCGVNRKDALIINKSGKRTWKP